ncbi:MAG: hypothetical protein KAQ93_01975 [Spirochaetales bacterium]|nr:hypothetical protein [Spirochaetales bacterium]
MKKFALLILGFLFVLQIVSGQSKVAVLDASLGVGVHPNASAIVADTINEQFVKSGDYIAIDRAYISSIQEEKKFQISGDVNSDDIKELGETFGAKYLCIANVSQLGSTYTVSARLIEVETAQVVVQESARRQGQIDVLFVVAEEVGSKLVGKEIVTGEQTQPVRQTTPVKPAPTQPAKTTSQSKSFSRTLISYMAPTYSGSGYDSLINSLDSYMGSGNHEEWKVGFDVHSLMAIDKYFYMAFSGSLGLEYFTSYFSDTYYDNDTDYLSFTDLDLRMTGGGIFPLGTILQVYGGLGIGFQYFILSDEGWDTTGTEPESLAFSYGIEIGTDFKLKNLVLGIRFQTGSSIIQPDTVFGSESSEEDINYTAFMIGAGFVF